MCSKEGRWCSRIWGKQLEQGERGNKRRVFQRRGAIPMQAGELQMDMEPGKGPAKGP